MSKRFWVLNVAIVIALSGSPIIAVAAPMAKSTSAKATSLPSLGKSNDQKVGTRTVTKSEQGFGKSMQTTAAKHRAEPVKPKPAQFNPPQLCRDFLGRVYRC